MTPKQKLVFDFINVYIQMKGYPPSFMNIAEGLNLKSKSNIHRFVHELEKKGLLKVVPHTVRSIQVIDKTISQMVKL
jgi:repressor LexA